MGAKVSTSLLSVVTPPHTTPPDHTTPQHSTMIPDSTTGPSDQEPNSSDEEATPAAPYRHLNLNQFLPNNPIGITDEELVNIPIKEINKTFKTTGLTTNDQSKMKKKRRTLKNRGYAETTRRKKEDEIKKLEAELKNLETERRDMQQERVEKELIHQKLANSNRFRLNWAQKFNIPIPEDIIEQMRTIEQNKSL